MTRYVTETIDAYYSADAADEDAFKQALSDAALRVHKDLIDRAGNDSRANMATTLSLWISVWPVAYLVQVGDSRYYMLRGDELAQISRDQTVGQELVDLGVLDPNQASQLRWADVLSISCKMPSTMAARTTSL